MKIAIIVVLTAIAIGFLYVFSRGNGCNICIPCCQACTGCTMISNDPSTWPSGDRIWLICHAIALQEGANIAGSAPDRNNNPGDISDGQNKFSSEYVDGSYVTTFPTKDEGWHWLYAKVRNIVGGCSAVYSNTWTWKQMGAKWSANGDAWGTGVAGILGVSPDSSVLDYYNS